MRTGAPIEKAARWSSTTSQYGRNVSEEIGREVDPGELEEAVIAELDRGSELVDAELDEETMRLSWTS